MINLTGDKYSSKKSVLVFGGIDPSSGSGITRDAISINKASCHPLCVTTSIVVQNNSEITNILPIPDDIFNNSIKLITKEFANIKAIKVGLVVSPFQSNLIKQISQDFGIKMIVDIPFVSSSGYQLLNPDSIEEICEDLLPNCYLYTPNIPEVDMHAAGHEGILQNGIANLLIKGGHSDDDYCTDILYTRVSSQENLNGKEDDVLYKFKEIKFTIQKYKTEDGLQVRGTGCALASFIAAYTARGFSLENAITEAKNQVYKQITKSYYLGGKARFLGN